jgi:hypothetical protein
LGGRGRWISEFEASLVYRVSSRIAKDTQRNPVSKKQQQQQKTKQNKFVNFFFEAGSLLCHPGCPGTLSVDQAALQLTDILLPLPLKC